MACKLISRDNHDFIMDHQVDFKNIQVLNLEIWSKNSYHTINSISNILLILWEVHDLLQPTINNIRMGFKIKWVLLIKTGLFIRMKWFLYMEVVVQMTSWTCKHLKTYHLKCYPWDNLINKKHRCSGARSRKVMVCMDME